MPSPAWLDVLLAVFCVRAPPCEPPVLLLAPGAAPGAELAWPVSSPPSTSAMRVACALRM